MKTAIENPNQPEVIALLQASDAYHAALYPPESNHLLDISLLLLPNVIFLVLRDDTERVVGCGAVVLHDHYGEIKRMYLPESERGHGYGRLLLNALIDHAQEAGMTQLKLETGIHQPEAIGLYRRAGFHDCPPFGNYKPDPLSVFMEMELV